MNATWTLTLGALALGCTLAVASPSAPAARPSPAGSGYAEQAALFAQKCAKCHTVGKGDRVGPDLKSVTRRRDRAWLAGFIAAPSQYLDSDPVARELLEKYGGVRMDDLGLSPAQVEALIAYVETVSEQAPAVRPPPAAVPRDRWAGVPGPDEQSGMCWWGLALCAAGVGGAVFLCRRDRRRAGSVLFVASLLGLYVSAGGRANHRLVGNDQGYAPVQPIPYSHALHAGKLEIACLYCHHNAEKGPVAGVPSLEICMNCHNRVKNVAGSDRPSEEIAKLARAWADRDKPDAKPLAWTRVHRLPAFVTFDHRSHVKNGIACQECHGPVQKMDVVRQAASLSMGWCVNCHRREGPDVPASWKRAPALQDCNACHQ